MSPNTRHTPFRGPAPKAAGERHLEPGARAHVRRGGAEPLRAGVPARRCVGVPRAREELCECD